MLILSPEDLTRVSKTLPTINPEEVIKGARDGDKSQIHTIGIHVLADPRLQTLEVAEILVSHLDVSKCPDPTNLAIQDDAIGLAVGRAIDAMSALSNFVVHSEIHKKDATLLQPIKDGWCGIWRWMTFFHAVSSNAQVLPPVVCKFSFELTAYALYCFTTDKAIMSLISGTPGVVALVTTLWMQEDGGALQPHFSQPICSSALCHVLATDAMLEEVVQTVGGGTSFVELGLSRLRALLDKPQIDSQYVCVCVNILITMTRNTLRVGTVVHNTRHALCLAVLRKGGVGLVTKALLRLSATPLKEENIPAVSSCLFFISDSVELGEGIPYVRQAIQQGLLQAFVNISPWFDRLDAKTQSHALRPIIYTIPRYLVHRSVIIDMDTAMHKLEASEERAKIDSAPVAVSDFWYLIKRISIEYHIVKWRADKHREVAMCDYCHKEASKGALRKCAACKAVLYCSKECQIAGWKKDHKAECKLKKADLCEQQIEDLPQGDCNFHHYLAIRDARRNIPRLESIATHDFPGVPKAKLGVSIDYNAYPPTFSMFLLDKHDVSGDLRLNGILDTLSENILERAKASDGEMLLIESRMCLGEICTVVMTLTTQLLWVGKDQWEEQKLRRLPKQGGDEDKTLTTADEINLLMEQCYDSDKPLVLLTARRKDVPADQVFPETMKAALDLGPDGIIVNTHWDGRIPGNGHQQYVSCGTARPLLPTSEDGASER